MSLGVQEVAIRERKYYGAAKVVYVQSKTRVIIGRSPSVWV